MLTVAASAADTRTAKALDSEEQSFLSIINNYRSTQGLETLTLNPQLNGVAAWMANDMATNNYFSHTDSLGRDPFMRMDQMGYAYNTWRGENLAVVEDAQAAFEIWMSSPGHNTIMLSDNYTVIGIGRAFDASSSFGWYWATEFGGYPPVPTPPPPLPEPVVTVVPVEPPPPPAPIHTPQPAPIETSKPLATPVSTTPTPEIKITHGSWWRSLQRVSDAWGRL